MSIGAISRLRFVESLCMSSEEASYCCVRKCLLYLYSLKINFPDRIYLLRGNHECRHLTQFFTFYRECICKYNELVYCAALQSFDSLPLAAVVNEQFLCVHGGLSPEISSLDDIREISRFSEPPSYGPFCDLLWSDPSPTYDKATDAGPSSFFLHNAVRGCAYYFSFDATCAFLEANNLLGVIRAHEVQPDGYRMYKRNPKNDFPAIITLFSAPNYLDMYGNKGALMVYTNDEIDVRQFTAVSHPYWLPNFLDAFSWSLPFVGDKLTQILMAVLNVCSKEELDDVSVPDLRARREVIRNKIKAVARMSRYYSVVKTERESILQLKTLLGSDTLPTGLLSSGPAGIREGCSIADLDGAIEPLLTYFV